MKTNKLKSTIAFLVMVSFTFISVFAGTAGDKTKSQKKISKTNTNDLRVKLDVNDLEYWTKNNGQGATDPAHGDAQGLYFPKGTANSAIYQDGFLWAGYLVQADGTEDLRSGGGNFVGGLQAGNIITAGTNVGGVYTAPVAANPTDARFKIYKVRRDWKLETDATLRAQLENDYKTWPFQDGAPAMKNAAGTADSIDADGFKVPLFIGDETIWYVMNDMDDGRSKALYGKGSVGIEVQVTMFAFKQSPYNTMFFTKRKMINKSGLAIKDMYVSQWSDPDLGDAGDDVVGSDRDLKLGYVYNGRPNDATYGTAVPAAGYVFLQGPMVPSAGKTAQAYGQLFADFENLPLSSFAFYINGGPANLGDPQLGNVNGTTQLYNYQQGLDFFGAASPTKFPLGGNPVRGTGDLDGRRFAPNDRRLMLSSGPFNVAVGDSQEIVTATIIGLGGDYLSSVNKLKELAIQAQAAYSLNFDVPPPPAPPVVKVTNINEGVVLDWSSNVNTNLVRTESHNIKNYEFEGYMIYQMPTASEIDFNKGKLVDAFDLVNGISTIRDRVLDSETGALVVKPVLDFGNSGVKRAVLFDFDKINNRPLINNREYYLKVYAVSAYHPNDDAAIGLGIASQLVSSTATFTVIPQQLPGERVPTSYGDPVTIEHTGPGQGGVTVKVVNPKDITGHSYKVVWNSTFDPMRWNVVNTTTLDTLYKTRTNDSTLVVSWLTQQADASGIDFMDVVEGLRIVVTGPALQYIGFQTVSNANGPLDPPEFGAADPNHRGFPRLNVNTDDQVIARQQVATGAGLGWGVHVAPGGTNSNFAWFTERSTRSGGNWSHIIPNDFELRFTAAGGKAIDWFGTFGDKMNVPFELWNIGVGTPTDVSDDYRLVPFMLDDGDGVFDIGGDHNFSGGADDPYSDWIYWYAPTNQTPGQAGYDAEAALIEANGGNYGADDIAYETIARLVVGSWNGGAAAPYARPLPETGTTFRIITAKPNQTTDLFTFSTSAPQTTAQTQKDDVKKINVFPNPYFGSSTLEQDRYNRQVTFTNLPTSKATIRIFTISGTFVNKIEHSNGTQFNTWNLTNANRLPVASGMYVVYIDTPHGTTTLKLAVIQETQYLDNI